MTPKFTMQKQEMCADLNEIIFGKVEHILDWLQQQQRDYLRFDNNNESYRSDAK